MEDVQEVKSKFELPPISKEDRDRINACDNYQLCKKIIQSQNDYREYEVGSAVFIRRKYDNKLVGIGYDNSGSPDKYIIIENDDGFLFAKKINANGKPGVAITCLTIDYSSDSYTLQVDDEYVEAMLLENEAGYDPTSSAKDLARRKSKATRENHKKRLVFDTDVEAYAHINSLTQGHKIWMADYSYGGGITEYEVESIDKRPAQAGSNNGWSRSYGDRDYTDKGFAQVVIVNLKVVSSQNNYSYNRKLEFKHISKESYPYMYFSSKPVSPEDIAK